VFMQSLFSTRPARALTGIIIALAALGGMSPAVAAGVSYASSPLQAAAQSAQTWASVASNAGQNVTANTPAVKTASKASTGTTKASATITHSTATAILANTRWNAEPCQSTTYAVGRIYEWKVPPGCYGGVYSVNTRNFVSRSGFGWCNWWPEVLHPNYPNVIYGTHHRTPIAGAVVVFAPGEQGAGSGGHYGEVVAVLGHGWLLISEMNNSWRGGFGRVTYRYVYESAGVSYVY
jgi:hypothetical protein